jgi:hypothetical protein
MAAQPRRRTARDDPECQFLSTVVTALFVIGYLYARVAVMSS